MDQTPNVRHVIYFPPLVKSQTAKEPKVKSDVQFHSLEKLQENGKNAQIDQTLLNQRPTPEDAAVIMYTSGSTGTPKGKIHRRFFSSVLPDNRSMFDLFFCS